MTTHRIIRNRKAYRFDNLANIDRLAIVANDPVLHLAAASLPQIGAATKPSVTSTAGMLVLGAATVIFGGDDRATAELRAQWPQVRRILIDAGIPAPDSPLHAKPFQDFRDKFLALNGGLAAANDVLRDVTQSMAIGQARDMGLLDAHEWNPDDNTWFEVPQQRVIMADGTWFKEQANVVRPNSVKVRSRFRTIRSTRAKRHNPSRHSTGVDQQGKASGYNHVVVAVRGGKRRQTILLDVVRAPGGSEMKALVPSLAWLHDRLGDIPLGFVYDGAMRGCNHLKIRQRFGFLSVNKAHGFDGVRFRDMLGKPLPANKKSFGLDFHTADGERCRHQLTLTAGMMYAVEDVRGVPTRVRIVDHLDTRRRKVGDRFEWELDLAVFCAHHDAMEHLTIDPNAPINGGARCEGLRIVAPNHEHFNRLYGFRNATESSNNYLKNTIMRTGRARSMTAERHEFDLRITTIIANSIAWAEHGTDRYLSVPGRIP